LFALDLYIGGHGALDGGFGRLIEDH